jgi:hypothetical protein
VTSIEEGRAEHDQGYFFRIPDWLADRLAQQRASGAAWALVTLVGRKTRWGQHTPQRITVPEMLEHTRYARQTITDALAHLVGWGVLYEERESDRRYVRYALVDLTACSGPYADGQGARCIDLLEHPAYPIPETSLKSRLVGTSRYQSKKQTDISLKTDNNRSKNKTDISLQSRPVATDQPPPEAAGASSLDNVDKRKRRKREYPPDGGPADADPAPDHQCEQHAAEQSDAPFPSELSGSGDTRDNGLGAAPASPTSLSKPSLFPSQSHVPVPAPSSPARAGLKARRKRDSKHKAGSGQTEAQAELDTRKAALAAAWLAHPATVPEAQMSETERRRFYSGIAKLAHSSLTLSELPALLDAQARWSRGTYTPDPHTMEASLGTLRREVATWSTRGTPSQKGTAHVRRHAGAWSGQHGRDDALVTKC